MDAYDLKKIFSVSCRNADRKQISVDSYYLKLVDKKEQDRLIACVADNFDGEEINYEGAAKDYNSWTKDEDQ